MKYLCLIYGVEANLATCSNEEMGKMILDYEAFARGIVQTGQYVAGEALQPTSTATTVRVRDGKTTVTDGPFAETKEQLGGFYMVEAADLNDAIQIASRIPGARFGSVEVRPVMDIHSPA
ncbi:MAG: YciI family protein [Fibrobacteria bacterium]|nr:YciI family protein [Fibrobacteria bacterium]